MRIEFKCKVEKCAMCGKEASSGGGQFYIVKSTELYFPFGWLGWWPKMNTDFMMLSRTKAHIICDAHGGHGRHTIIEIDG